MTEAMFVFFSLFILFLCGVRHPVALVVGLAALLYIHISFHIL